MLNASQRKIAWIAGAIIPAIAGLLGAFVLWRWLPYPMGTACGLTLLTLLVVTIYTDSYWKKIPNWATYPAFVWLLIFNAFGSFWTADLAGQAIPKTFDGWPAVGPISLGAIGIGNSLLGALACFSVMVVLSGWLKSSGGDVKLLTVIGACVGAQYGLLAMCLGYILAGAYSLAICIWHYGLFSIVKGTVAWLGNLFLPLVFAKPEISDDRLLKTGVPLGAHFALGTVIAMTPIIPGVHF